MRKKAATVATPTDQMMGSNENAKGVTAPRKFVSESSDEAFDSDVRTELSGDELHRRISEAAYYRAQQRGFCARI